MKTKQKNKLSLLCIIPGWIMLCMVPALGYSQAGINDATFNTLNDNARGGPKGTNYTVTTSLLQPDGKIIIAGNFTSYNGKAARGIVRMNADGSTDLTFNSGSGVNGTILTLVLQPDNKILISGDFSRYNGVRTNYIARLNANGSIDASFRVGAGAGANGSVSHAVIQPDGKILIAGKFTQYNGGNCRKIIRLNKNGVVDPTFLIQESIVIMGEAMDLGMPDKMALQPDGNLVVGFVPGGMANKVMARFKPNGDMDPSFDCSELQKNGRKFGGLIIQADGKIIAGGGYEMFGSEDNSGFLIRLNKDGSADTSFQCNLNPVPLLHSVAMQQNGKIILAGRYAYYTDGIRNTNYIGRLDTNGVFDSAFQFDNWQAEKANLDNWTVSVQADGKVVVGGSFSSTWGNIIRLNYDGSRDIYFNKTNGANGTVKSIAVQQNNKIIIAGNFSSYNVVARNTIARLYSDGKLDPAFDPGKGANGKILSAVVQPGGKIIIAGTFTQFNGVSQNHIARLNESGSIDNTYTVGAGATGTISCISLQPDGKLIIGGNMTSYNGVPLNGLARLNKNGTLDLVFNAQVKNLPFTYTNAIKLLYDGKILIGSGSNLYKLNNDGSMDPTFVQISEVEPIKTIITEEDDKILIAEGFSDLMGGLPEGYITRRNPDGSKDNTYAGGRVNDFIRTVTILANKKILVGHAKGVCRLNSDCTDDSTAAIESAGANDQVWCSAPTSGGKVIIGGDFTTYGGTPRNGLARLEQAAPVLQNGILTQTDKPFNEQENSLLNVYPNPATYDITVANLTPGSTLRVFNMLGELVEKQIVNNEKISIPTSNYMNGFYFISNENNGKTTNVKFTVNRQ